MRRHSRAVLYWGVGLFVVGLFFTFFTFGSLSAYRDEVTWGTVGVLGLTGLGALAYTIVRPTKWWYFIPAFLLLSMATVVYLGLMQHMAGIWLAAVVFLALGFAHLAIFLTHMEERWWAWISAGGFFLLTGMLVVSDYLNATMTTLILFLGLAVVFYVLYLVMPRQRQRWWSLALATALAIVGGFTFTAATEASATWAVYWPLVLILLGIALLVWYLVQILTATERRRIPPEPMPSPESPYTATAPSPAVEQSPEGSVEVVPSVNDVLDAGEEERGTSEGEESAPEG